MKRLFVLIAILGMTQMSVAQSDNKAFKEDAMKLIKVSNNAVEASFSQVYAMIPDENLDAFKKELKPIMDNYYEKMAVISMDVYTHEEVKKLLEFYNSKLGKKFIEAQTEITKKAMRMGQELSAEIMPVVQKYRK